MFIRIDSTVPVASIDRLQLTKSLEEQYDAIVISDYNKGFLSTDDIEYILKKHPLTFLDTKKRLGPWANNATFIKINRKEYSDSEPISDILKPKIIQTKGEEGCEYQGKIYTVGKVDIKNLSGAGDSFLAGLVVKYVETQDIEKSLNFANEVATIVVQKIGVSTVKD